MKKCEEHRIAVCYRMAKLLNMGEVILDLTTHKVRWAVVKDDNHERIFNTLEEMEAFLEKEFEQRFRNVRSYRGLHQTLVRRHQVILERERSRKTGEPMTLCSVINR